MARQVVPLINGHRYSFSSIEMEIGAEKDSVTQYLGFVGITAINYAEKVQQVAIYGHEPIRLGRTVGPRTLTADIQMYRFEWMALSEHIGFPLGRRKLTIVIQYADKDQPVDSDVIEGWLSEIESSNAEGTEPLTVKLSFEPFDIKWGGLPLEAPGTDGSFWLNDQEGIEGKDYPDNPWDRVRIGGIYLPGVSTVKGLPTLKVDSKPPAGVDGATVTVSGHLPGPIDVECRIWTPSQWQLFQSYVAPRIWRLPNKDAKGKISTEALVKTISHPSLTVWNITSVVVLGVSVPETSEPGVKLIRIKCLQYIAPVPKNQTKTTKKALKEPTESAVLKPGTKNSAGDSPGKTDTSLSGPAVSKKAGAS